MWELDCRYDSRQSFYGKAMVKVTYDINTQILTLYSYGTEVAKIERTGNTITCEYYGKYSQTTTRHQKEFFKQEGLSNYEIKELWKNGILEITI